MGDGLAAGVNVGPLISASAREKTEEFVADAVSKGAKVLTGGKRPASPIGATHPGKGYFYEPTVLEHATPHMKVVSQEIFGPVVSLCFAFELLSCAHSAN